MNTGKQIATHLASLFGECIHCKSEVLIPHMVCQTCLCQQRDEAVRERDKLFQTLQKAKEAAEGALVLANCYFERDGRDGCNNDNYCRLVDFLKELK